MNGKFFMTGSGEDQNGNEWISYYCEPADRKCWELLPNGNLIIHLVNIVPYDPDVSNAGSGTFTEIPTGN